MTQQEEQRRKQEREASQRRQTGPSEQVKGSADTEKTSKVITGKEFEKKAGKAKPVMTMEEFLKKKRGSAADAEAEEEAKRAKKKGKKQGIDY